jgi:PucR family transcriptional regulator, purine catabolism regulatory protein
VLTVSDIVALSELELNLVAGADGASAPVRWVHSSELIDPTPWLRGGEILLTTGRPLESDSVRFVELLAGRGLAGLGLGLGFGFDELPEAARAAADRRNFPVFTIPYHIPFIAITEAVFTGISNQRVAETERRLAGDLVEAIVAGDISARELRRRTRAFGLRGTLPLTFVMLRADGDSAAALTRIADATTGSGPTSVRDGIVAVLIEAADDPAAEARAAELLTGTGAMAAGVGRVRDEPAQLRRCYDEALYALDVHVAGAEPSVSTFRELGSMQLLLSLQDERAIELYCDAVLGPLVTHDAVHGSELIPTLSAYIEANGRWAEAAAAMNVHRHTLRYRIRKIEQLTGRDLTDARDRLELWLALRAEQLSRGERQLEVVG